jgi:hypothetical protein
LPNPAACSQNGTRSSKNCPSAGSSVARCRSRGAHREFLI